jgi:hypothetical protein
MRTVNIAGHPPGQSAHRQRHAWRPFHPAVPLTITRAGCRNQHIGNVAFHDPSVVITGIGLANTRAGVPTSRRGIRIRPESAVKEHRILQLTSP